MAIKLAHYGTIIMFLIIAFALTHLGVSIAILITDQHYDDIFRPEIGLAAYNLSICFFGMLVGLIGAFSLLTERDILGKLIAIVSGVLSILAVASLTAIIIINSNSSTYVTRTFTNHMYRYRTDPNAREVIDRIQANHQCCGRSISLDWAYMPFMSMNSRKRRDIMLIEQPEKENIPLEFISTDLLESAVSVFRRKRQSIVTGNSITNISYANKFQVPTSCCISYKYRSSVVVPSNCSVIEQLNNKGCLKFIVKRSNMQDLGIAVINSFMVALALVAIPFLLHGYSIPVTDMNNFSVKPVEQVPAPNFNYPYGAQYQGQYQAQSANSYL